VPNKEYLDRAENSVLLALRMAYFENDSEPVTSLQVRRIGEDFPDLPTSELEDLRGTGAPMVSQGGWTPFDFTDRTTRWLKRLVKKGKVIAKPVGKRKVVYEPVEPIGEIDYTATRTAHRGFEGARSEELMRELPASPWKKEMQYYIDMRDNWMSETAGSKLAFWAFQTADQYLESGNRENVWPYTLVSRAHRQFLMGDLHQDIEGRKMSETSLRRGFSELVNMGLFSRGPEGTFRKAGKQYSDKGREDLSHILSKLDRPEIHELDSKDIARLRVLKYKWPELFKEKGTVEKIARLPLDMPPERHELGPIEEN